MQAKHKTMTWHHYHTLKQHNLLSSDHSVHFLKLVAQFSSRRLVQVFKVVALEEAHQVAIVKLHVAKCPLGQPAFSLKGSQMWNILPINI